ncbi:MAG: thioredoxin family protein [Bdellovibrionales bacterium]|nr:thioredoxin family protein [Bdellovibrionales bacterium]
MFKKLVLTILTCAAPLASAEKDFSSWRKFSQGELISETTALTPGATATVGLRIRLAPKWHTYWVNPGDSGTAIRLNFDNSHGLRVVRVMMPIPKRFETGPLISFGYDKEVIIPIELDVDKDAKIGDTAHIQVDAEWLVCEDVCIPAIDTLKLDVPIGRLEDVKPTDHFNAFQKVRARVPQVRASAPQYIADGENMALMVKDWPADRDFAEFFPFKNSGVTNEAPVVSTSAEGLLLKLHKANVPQAKADRTGVLVMRNKSGQVEAWQFGDSGWSFEQSKPKASLADLWWMLLSAFVGGLILNLMPCVFPILSIKLLSLLKLAEKHPDEVRSNNFAYVAGVLVSFVLIALLLSGLRSAGTLVGWGFQLQSPVFLSLLSWLFFVLALNLLGLFELDIFDAGFGQKLTRLGGLPGSFFTGVLAVVVASPCTAPFMGVALGFGLSQPTYVLFAVFACLGLGLAFPYLVFAIFPSWIRILPKPGMWMMRLKQAMAFPLLLTLVWLLWVLGQVRGPNAVAFVLAGCVTLGFAFWLSAWRRLIAALIAAITVVGGLTYIYRAERRAVSVDAGPDIWQPYSPALLESLRGKNVFVNMTADWCLTCKVNERLVFSDPEVVGLFEKKNIVLIKGDWTQRNEEITLFLNRYERVGVPFYVLYSPQHPNGQVLPEVLTKSTFMDWIHKEFP